MKKSYLLFVLLLSFLTIQAQDIEQKNSSQNFNEVKLNGLFLVLGAFEVTYERTLNEESAVGISAFLPVSNDVSDDVKYFISPYYRLYFGNKYAAGFYVEGFGMLNSTNRNINFFGGEKDFKTDFALGIGLGGKWVTKSGFIGEIGFGVGRNLFNNSNTDYEIIGKGGITIGYRF